MQAGYACMTGTEAVLSNVQIRILFSVDCLQFPEGSFVTVRHNLTMRPFVSARLIRCVSFFALK
jgi:hypothetical protein